MKKFLIIAAVLTAFSLQAGDAAIPQLGKAKATQVYIYCFNNQIMNLFKKTMNI